MDQIALKVKKEFCAECSMALRRFIGKMDGVDSVDTEEGEVVIRFDEKKIDGERLRRIAGESLDKLGYSIQE
ncbi:MAG: heavy-metal-associated domain-containing protein [bacterium]